jgi:hypothetical protein
VVTQSHPPAPCAEIELDACLVNVGDGSPFARQGDSGAVVVDEDDCVVGMVVALKTATRLEPKPDDPAFVVPIVDVLNGLGVRLAGPDRACVLC